MYKIKLTDFYKDLLIVGVVAEFSDQHLNEHKMNRDLEKTMESEYFWIVLCKNHWRHIGHPILLGETDAFSDPPHLDGDFNVKCDVCGKECSYSSSDLLRFEAEASESFPAHPLFADAA